MMIANAVFFFAGSAGLIIGIGCSVFAFRPSVGGRAFWYNSFIAAVGLTVAFVCLTTLARRM